MDVFSTELGIRLGFVKTSEFQGVGVRTPKTPLGKPLLQLDVSLNHIISVDILSFDLLKSTLVLSPNLRLCHLSCLFTGYPTKTLYVFLLCPHTCHMLGPSPPT
jgi:hypothetical protein